MTDAAPAEDPRDALIQEQAQRIEGQAQQIAALEDAGLTEPDRRAFVGGQSWVSQTLLNRSGPDHKSARSYVGGPQARAPA